jgi:Arc/MetJ family transcription regulator
MRTNIDIDDDLLTEAMAATGLATKRATVEEALRQLVLDHRRRKALEDSAGIGWEGDLDEMRTDGPPDDIDLPALPKQR